MVIANAVCDIHRGSEVDEYNDVADTDTERVAIGVAASIIERSRVVYDPATLRSGVVSSVIGRFRPGTDVQAGDRVTDTLTGDVFVVSSVHDNRSGLFTPDVVTDLERNLPGAS